MRRIGVGWIIGLIVGSLCLLLVLGYRWGIAGCCGLRGLGRIGRCRFNLPAHAAGAAVVCGAIDRIASERIVHGRTNEDEYDDRDNSQDQIVDKGL